MWYAWGGYFISLYKARSYNPTKLHQIPHTLRLILGVQIGKNSYREVHKFCSINELRSENKFDNSVGV